MCSPDDTSDPKIASSETLIEGTISISVEHRPLEVSGECSFDIQTAVFLLEFVEAADYFLVHQQAKVEFLLMFYFRLKNVEDERNLFSRRG